TRQVERSRARWMSDASDTWASICPVAQSTLPETGSVIVLMTHVLVAGSVDLTGSGAPKRHPTSLQVRGVPVSAADVAARASAVPLQPETRVSVVPELGTSAGNGTLLSRVRK